MTRFSGIGGGFSGYATISRSFAVSGGTSEYLGAVMLFLQSSAPTGWIKDTTYDDYALRLTSGTVSSGGTIAFSSIYTTQSVSGSVSGTVTVGGTTLSTPQLPVHNHGAPGQHADYLRLTPATGTVVDYTQPTVSSSAGGGLSHTHGTSAVGSTSFTGAAQDFSIKYVDTILASKV